MTNFEFLKQEWPELYESSVRVESMANSDARAACFYARRTLEMAITWLYAHDPAFKKPYDDNLSAMLHEPSFRNNIPQGIYVKARLLKDLGNLAVHSNKPVRRVDSLQATTELFHFLFWLARTYSRASAAQFSGITFDHNLLPQSQTIVIKQTAEQLRKLQAQLDERDAQLAQKDKALSEIDAEIARLQSEIAEAKARNKAIPDDHDYSEAETRDYFIDLLLREAGWPLEKAEDREYPITGMPSESGKGFVDYVLWGDNGLPLGLVEAKRTKKDPRIGQQQAKLYADCLEAKFKQRPIIFYTNGYDTWIWDDKDYPPRKVQGFYKKDELELLIQRRVSKKDLKQATINKDIVDRYYQENAIRALAEEFQKCARKGLVVMATGAGKTRTVVALCELLQRCNWAKRILFLADRRALVRQAANAFKKHLSDASPVNLAEERGNTDGRVMVSTYQTMMGLIDETKDEARRFGVGHFDLVIIDEAHRSVYQKYRAIFEYFDSLLVGLTATPKNEVDKNTYGLFDLEGGVPTYAYDLNQAVEDHYLVPPKPVSVPLKFLREGIKYDQLTEEEKERWDVAEWNEEDGVPDSVDPAALNKWLFNADTVDKVLETLMTRGLTVAGGDRIGKTIIFAKNHRHALFIEERFNFNYPHLKGAHARIIDNYETYAQSLLDDFSTVEKMPHIAISVDMLDTGIDVPEVVNLVFFKLVRSKTKFFQMIGRGTRLSPNLFGPEADKEYFYIFDYCQNLEFFNQNAAGVEGNLQEPLSKRLFLHRLALLSEVQKGKPQDEPIKEFQGELTDTLQTEVAAMNIDNFVVRPHRRYVEKYSDIAAWEDLSHEEVVEIGQELAGLPSQQEQDDETAKRFDLLILKIQLAVLQYDPLFERLRDQVKEIASQLELKDSIPMVNAEMELILEIQTDEYWIGITLPILDHARKHLRNLIVFIDKKARGVIYTDFEDRLGEIKEVSIAGVAAAIDLKQYRKKVMHFLEEHENDIVLNKLKHNMPLTELDIQELERLLFESGEVGTREEFERAYGKQESLGVFIRRLVGLDREAAKKAFGDYLNNKTLTANQIQFINLIIDDLTKNGIMDPGLLYESPYTDYSPKGLDGVFTDSDAGKIVDILTAIRKNAAA